MMNRVNFGRLSGTIVDVCKGHGTFLDPGELHRIVKFIRSGGLERARARQLEELKDQERKVRDAESRAARDRGQGDRQQRQQAGTLDVHDRRRQLTPRHSPFGVNVSATPLMQ